jgi:hypothetical protein
VKQRWTCPKCDNSIVLHVAVHVPPVCHNKTVHSSKPQEMLREKDADRNV